jgi:hypothetical protein
VWRSARATDPRLVRTATMAMRRTRARPMATTVLLGSRVVSLSAPARGTAADGTDVDGTEPVGAEAMDQAGTVGAFTDAPVMATTAAVDTVIAAVLPAHRPAAVSAAALLGAVSMAADVAERSLRNRTAGGQRQPFFFSFTRWSSAGLAASPGLIALILIAVNYNTSIKPESQS